MKADNEPAISLPLYYKSVKKWKYVLKKEKQNATKKKRKKSPSTGVKAHTSDVWGQHVINCATTANVKEDC